MERDGKPGGLKAMYENVWHGLAFAPLLKRDVLPDEINEDPVVSEESAQLRSILADVAQIAFTDASDASFAIHEIQSRLRREPVNAAPTKRQDVDQYRGADLEILRTSVRALVVHLDPDTSDEMQESFTLLNRLSTLVAECEIAKIDAIEAANAALQQCGKETLARVKAERDGSSVVEALGREREASRRIVHAAILLIMAYLAGKGIALSQVATDLNDAIHDWLDTQPEGEAKRATCEFIERRIRPTPQPGALDPAGFTKGAGGITAQEFAEGVASVFPPMIPPPPEPPALPLRDRLGGYVATAGFWILDKLYPKT